MFIPDNFPKESRAKIRKCFFGHLKSPQKVFLSPIRSIFNKLGQNFEQTNGWWEAKTNGNILVAHTPQGSPILDAVSSFDPGTLLSYIGLAGSFGNIQVGEIVEIKYAHFPQEIQKYERNFPEPLEFKAVRIMTVNCLGESFEMHKTFAKIADCVDMETALIYAACQKQNKFARSIQIISDNFDSLPFYSTVNFSIEIPLAELTNILI